MKQFSKYLYFRSDCATIYYRRRIPQVLEQASVAAKAVCTVSCDKATSYPKLVAATIPHALVSAQKRAKDTGNYDPMFSLNHTCAKIRAGVAVMARKTWTTTKSIE